ncbi:hypothetical protein [Pectobacterium polaris]|uniref:hypothetical protein n=1 Tax=Pectobacterium polaris TaxID=2042057 RepID=UPI000F8ECB60|nr:hypothetical protein [Pectobacterium polaris]RUR96431.1 hypothetical protein KHDHEBDM_02624 [Pectobacterium polaris]
MAGKKPQESTETPEISTESVEKIEVPEKTCFIIMPIAEHPDYAPGHFQRVYEYLIKPACIDAGLTPYRADDNKASDMIMLDILQKIVECDMAICDISSRNANVFFELGLRQAFNKKTILITDGRQSAPFDISGLRHIVYSPDLRVDTVDKTVPEIKEMLIKTENLPDDKVNSIVQLLKIKPAKVDAKDLPPLDSAVYSMFHQLQEQISKISKNQKETSKSYFTWKGLDKSVNEINLPGILIGNNFDFIMNNYSRELFHLEYSYSGEEIGHFNTIDDSDITFKNRNTGTISCIPNTYENRIKIIAVN